MEVGVSVLPKLPRDAGDRNRTSPFAFTGNKFEFRAVGSSFSIAGPNTVLNTIVAESLDFIATQLEAATKGGKALNKAIQDLLPGILKESKKVVFNGDNYTEEWHKEAEKRGLPNLQNTVDSLPVIVRKDSVELFAKYKVYSERELQSRYNIFSEKYVKEVTIEANMMVHDGQDDDPAGGAAVPGARWRTAVNATKAAGVDAGAQLEHLRELTDDDHASSRRRPRRWTRRSHHHARRRRLRPRQVHPRRRWCRRWPTCGRSATSWRRWSPTTSGRCRPTARCCSSSERCNTRCHPRAPGRLFGGSFIQCAGAGRPSALWPGQVHPSPPDWVTRPGS